jgi:diguanylate cyclase (GGDEF)-like protein/PAS domain S-box-containing protein
MSDEGKVKGEGSVGPRGGSRPFPGTPEALRNLIEYAADAFFVHDHRGRILEVNRRACESLGYACEELLALSIQDLEAEVSGEDLIRLWSRLAPGQPVTVDGRHRRKDGTTFPVEVRVGLFEVGGEGSLILALARDVTERKWAEERLLESERRFRQLFEQSVEALFLHDEEGRLVDCNREAYRSLGYRREELLELHLSDFVVDLIPPSERETRRDTPWKRALGGTRTEVSFHENRHRRKDGTTFPVEVGIGSIEHGGRRLILASCRDITERKALEEALAHRASHDSLTGLPNGTVFRERLAQALSRSSRRGDRVAVMFLDLDDFKNVNDSLGHHMGDRLLVAVAERLRSCVRTEDTVARLHGDEFVVLLEDLTREDETLRVAERILKAMRRTFVLGGQEIHVTPSLGVALSPADGEARSGRDLVEDADEAMYRVKRAGGDGFHLFGEGDETP